MVRFWRTTSLRSWLVQTLTPILCGLLILLSVTALGRLARAALRERQTYSVAFNDIECTPPPGMSRPEFLKEVRELAHQPAALRLLEKDLSSRLKVAFAVHPCVETVRSVRLVGLHAANQTARLRVRVDVVPRRAVLAVRPSNTGLSWNGDFLVVDRKGILLPASAEDANLPVLTTAAAVGNRSVGQLWDDPGVRAAAATVAFLQPKLSRLKLESCEVEIMEGDLVLRAPGVRIVWGRAPGQEEEGEAAAEVKLQRLLTYQSGHESLASLEHDVRLLAYQGHFPLSPARP